MIEIELKRLPHGEGLPLPSYATAGAAGLDVVAAEDLTLAPGQRHAVATDSRSPFRKDMRFRCDHDRACH